MEIILNIKTGLMVTVLLASLLQTEVFKIDDGNGKGGSEDFIFVSVLCG